MVAASNAFLFTCYLPLLKSMYKPLPTSSSYVKRVSGLMGSFSTIKGICMASHIAFTNSGSNSLTLARSKGTNLGEPPGNFAMSDIICVR